VYDRIQRLFGDHPDLLREFSYFLPDTQGEMGGRQLLSNKQRAKQQRQRERQEARGAAGASSCAGGGGGGGGDYDDDEDERRAAAPKTRTVSYPAGSEKEIALFERIKQTVPRLVWTQFLRTLNLYACDVLTRQEMVLMVTDVLTPRVGSAMALVTMW
jgi:paired amphipathic helix protein Sin3a